MNALETTLSALRKMTAGQLAAWAQTHGIDLSSLLLAECKAYAEAQLSNSEALPAADPWIKIEPGCEMPQVGKQVLLLFPNGEVWLGSLYRHVDNWDAWQWHSDKDRSRGWTGFGSNGGPTHYAVVRMPEAE